MKNLTCGDCKYFRQHYIFNGERLSRVHCGHCVHPRLKHRTPSTPSCPNFEQRMVGVEQFITKDFITKELLEYVLSLDLPPEITE